MMPKSAKRFSDDIMVHLIDFAAYMRRQVILLGYYMLWSSRRFDERAPAVPARFFSRICATPADSVWLQNALEQDDFYL
jgi:hypothetical protein